jgi:hypothetical protein
MILLLTTEKNLIGFKLKEFLEKKKEGLELIQLTCLEAQQRKNMFRQKLITLLFIYTLVTLITYSLLIALSI